MKNIKQLKEQLTSLKESDNRLVRYHILSKHLAVPFTFEDLENKGFLSQDIMDTINDMIEEGSLYKVENKYHVTDGKTNSENSKESLKVGDHIDFYTPSGQIKVGVITSISNNKYTVSSKGTIYNITDKELVESIAIKDLKKESFEDWKKSKTGKLLINKGLNDEELLKQYNLVKDFYKDTEILESKESTNSRIKKLKETVAVLEPAKIVSADDVIKMIKDLISKNDLEAAQTAIANSTTLLSEEQRKEVRDMLDKALEKNKEVSKNTQEKEKKESLKENIIQQEQAKPKESKHTFFVDLNEQNDSDGKYYTVSFSGKDIQTEKFMFVVTVIRNDIYGYRNVEDAKQLFNKVVNELSSGVDYKLISGKGSQTAHIKESLKESLTNIQADLYSWFAKEHKNILSLSTEDKLLLLKQFEYELNKNNKDLNDKETNNKEFINSDELKKMNDKKESFDENNGLKIVQNYKDPRELENISTDLLKKLIDIASANLYNLNVLIQKQAKKFYSDAVIELRSRNKESFKARIKSL